MQDITNLCNKYDLPNVKFHRLKEEHINTEVQRVLVIKVFLTLKILKSVSIIPTVIKRKLMQEHWTFSPMESRAITAFNTGHLVFKSTKQFKFKGKLGGTKRCLFDNCNNVDTLYHALWGHDWKHYSMWHLERRRDEHIKRFHKFRI